MQGQFGIKYLKKILMATQLKENSSSTSTWMITTMLEHVVHRKRYVKNVGDCW